MLKLKKGCYQPGLSTTWTAYLPGCADNHVDFILVARGIDEASGRDLPHGFRKDMDIVPTESLEEPITGLPTRQFFNPSHSVKLLTVGLLHPTPKSLGIIASSSSGFELPSFCAISFFANCKLHQYPRLLEFGTNQGILTSLAPSASGVPFKINLNL